MILSGYLIVKSDFRVENDGIIHILGNNITLNSSFLSYMIGNSKGVYFYQPHNISIINGMLISDIKAFNAYTTKVLKARILTIPSPDACPSNILSFIVVEFTNVANATPTLPGLEY